MRDIILVAGVCVIGVCLEMWFIRTEHRGTTVQATIRKGIASLTFVGWGVYCYAQNGNPSALWILAGLIFGLLGDVLLHLRFLHEGARSNRVFAVGVASFLVGHFLYIVFLAERAYGRYLVAVLGTLLIAAVAEPPLIRRVKVPARELKIFGIIYITVVVAMFSFSVAQTVAMGMCGLSVWFMVGALCFLMSDYMMVYYTFVRKTRMLRIMNLLLYYVGQLLIATSILYIP